MINDKIITTIQYLYYIVNEALNNRCSDNGKYAYMYYIYLELIYILIYSLNKSFIHSLP